MVTQVHQGLGLNQPTLLGESGIVGLQHAERCEHNRKVTTCPVLA